MTSWKCLGAAILIASVLSAQQVTEDPVMKARSQRSVAADGGEGDLPPVPRGILEPPPLPPPVMHVKDTRGYRASRRVRRSRTRSVRGAKGHPATSQLRKKLPKKKP